MVIENKKVQGYKDLLVWQKGIQLAKEIYRITQSLPNEEKFGLVSSNAAGAVSIPSNIAEGQARHTTQEFVQFVSHAEGSVRGAGHTVDTCGGTRFMLRRAGHRPSGLLSDLRKMLNAVAESAGGERKVAAVLAAARCGLLTVDSYSPEGVKKSRLCRPLCGKAQPFRPSRPREKNQ